MKYLFFLSCLMMLNTELKASPGQKGVQEIQKQINSCLNVAKLKTCLIRVNESLLVEDATQVALFKLNGIGVLQQKLEKGVISFSIQNEKLPSAHSSLKNISPSNLAILHEDMKNNGYKLNPCYQKTSAADRMILGYRFDSHLKIIIGLRFIGDRGIIESNKTESDFNSLLNQNRCSGAPAKATATGAPA